MELGRELLFFFSALGAFNGLVIGLYFLLFAKPRHTSNYFLGILLLGLSIRIGKSVVYFFNPDLAGVFLQFGLSACLFVGPSLYFYLRSVLQPDIPPTDWKYHYFPLLIIITLLNIIYQWDTSHAWRYIFDAIYLIWLIYLILSVWILRFKLLKLFQPKSALTSMEVWVNSIFIGNVLIWIVYNTLNYTSYIVGALSFSFIFYLLILLMIFTKKKDPGFMSRQVKYGNKRINETEADQLIKQLNELMNKEELFIDPDLKLPYLAQRLNILPHTLSQLLNENLNKNFTSFINEYRIEFAKKMIQTEAHLKLEAIGYDCGFNSKSTFYSTFKKLTGTTPASFKEEKSNS